MILQHSRHATGPFVTTIRTRKWN